MHYSDLPRKTPLHAPKRATAARLAARKVSCQSSESVAASSGKATKAMMEPNLGRLRVKFGMRQLLYYTGSLDTWSFDW